MSMQQNNNIWCLCRKLRPIELQQHRQWLSCVWWKKCFALTVSSLGVFSMLCCDGDCSLLILLGFHDERETKLRSWGSCAGGFASASHAWSSQGPKVLGLESWQFVNDLLRFMTILAKRLLMMALCQCLVSVALLSLMTRSTLLRHYRHTGMFLLQRLESWVWLMNDKSWPRPGWRPVVHADQLLSDTDDDKHVHSGDSDAETLMLPGNGEDDVDEGDPAAPHLHWSWPPLWEIVTEHHYHFFPAAFHEDDVGHQGSTNDDDQQGPPSKRQRV